VIKMPFHMGPWEIILIVVIILIFFGAGKLPQVGGAIGKGIRALKKSQQDENGDGESVKGSRI
jgi:sec-independent protein translocase protein TatA